MSVVRTRRAAAGGAGRCLRAGTRAVVLGAVAALAGVAPLGGAVLLAGVALLGGAAPPTNAARAQVATARGADASRSTEAGADVVAGVRKLLADQRAAWNRGDLAGFMDGYWKSDSLTFYSGGEVEKGWRAAYERYVRRYQSEGREMGRLDFDIHSILPLSRDLALVRGGWFLKRSSDAPHGVFTLVVRRFPSLGWRIVHDHTSSAE